MLIFSKQQIKTIMKKIEISYQYLLIGLFILIIEMPLYSQNFSGGNGDGYASGEILGVDLRVIPTSLTVSVNKEPVQADTTNLLPIKFEVVFSRPVTGFTFDDIEWSGSISASEITGELIKIGETYTINIVAIGTDGSLIPNIPAGIAADANERLNLASTSVNNLVVYDITSPSPEIHLADGQNNPTNATPVNFKVVFSENVIGFDHTKITLSGSANPTTMVVTGGAKEFNIAVSGMNGDGFVTIEIPLSQVADAAGNLNTASLNTQNSVEYLISPLTVNINQAVAQADPVNTLPIIFDVVFNRPVTGLTFDDFVWSGTAGIVSGNLSGSGAIYQVSATGVSVNGTLIASLPAYVATDAAGNQNQPSTSTDNSVTFDNTRPSVEITLADGQTSLALNSPINFKATFSEPVTGFDHTKVELSGTAGATTIEVTGGPEVYNLAVSGMTGDGTVMANIPADQASDLAGNLNTASINSQNSVDYITPLTVTLNQALGQADPVNTLPIVFDVVFNRPVIDFTFDKVVLSGTASGVNGHISGTGAIYTIHITQIEQEGNVVARIPAGLVSDLFGLSNHASTSSDNSVRYDITHPTVEINLAPTQTTPTNEALISFNADFSEPVVGFEVSDIQLSGNSGANTVYIRGGPQYFTIDVSGMDSPGNIMIRIPQNVVNDRAGNLNFESKNTQNTVYFDNLKPDVTIRSSKTSPTPLEEIPLTIEFSKEVTGFELTDISVDNGIIISLEEQNPKNVWLAALSPANAGMVRVQIPANVAADAAKNNNNASNHFQIEYLGEDFSFEANNIFTPNSLQNRFWIIKNIEYYKEYELIIRNKSGQEVFRTINYKNDWNGTYKNKPLPTGTYYYFYSSQNKKTNYKGYINIIYE
jgi:gliding motility-associated-like protein